MKKGIEFTQSQIKALEEGATMFIIPIDSSGSIPTNQDITKRMMKYDEEEYVIRNFAPIQKGEEFFIKEEFAELLEDVDDIDSEMIYYRANGEIEDCVDTDYDSIVTPWQPASQMQEHQARYIGECIDVRVARVQELTTYERESINGHKSNCSKMLIKTKYNNQLKEQNINRTYEDNDYIFLIETKGLK